MQFSVYFTMEEGQQLGRSAPSPEEMAEIGKFHEEATKSGVIVATGRPPERIQRRLCSTPTQPLRDCQTLRSRSRRSQVGAPSRVYLYRTRFPGHTFVLCRLA